MTFHSTESIGGASRCRMGSNDPDVHFTSLLKQPGVLSDRTHYISLPFN